MRGREREKERDKKKRKEGEKEITYNGKLLEENQKADNSRKPK